MTPQEQNLLDQYVRGALSLEQQAEFDSRFSNDPLFSESAVSALAAHLGEPDSSFVEETARRLDGRAAGLWAQAGLTAGRAFGFEFKSLAASLALLAGAYGYLWMNRTQDAHRALSASAPVPSITFTLPTGELSAWENRPVLPEATAPQAARPSYASVAAPTQVSAGEPAAAEHSVSAPTPKEASLQGKVLRIRVEVPRDVQGKVVLTDVQGDMVRHLFNGKMPAGTWALDWDQRNDQGVRVPAGDYTVLIETGGEVLKGQVSVSTGS